MAAACRLGLIPLVSHAVNEMKGPFDDIGENDFTDVELSLSVLCTSDDTIEVTSNDFVLDARRNDVMPVGEASASQKKHTVTYAVHIGKQQQHTDWGAWVPWRKNRAMSIEP